MRQFGRVLFFICIASALFFIYIVWWPQLVIASILTMIVSTVPEYLGD